MDNNPQIDQASLLPVGTLLQGGKYRIEKYLSSGNFGNTYVITNVAFGEKFAMKEFFLRGYAYRTRGSKDVTKSPAVDPAMIDAYQEKFRKEARRMRELKGEHVVHVHDLFDENLTSYYVMDFVDGRPRTEIIDNLNDPCSDYPDIDGSLAAKILGQILDAMVEVHAKNIWHLDLKPDNIMVDPKRGVVIIDFGASKQLGKSGRFTGTTDKICYTPGFAAPEQIEQKIDEIGPWTDIYAIGATIFNHLTGKVPSIGVPQKKDFLTSSNSVNPKLIDLVQKMMNPDPKKRPQSIGEVQTLLKDVLADLEKERKKRDSKNNTTEKKDKRKDDSGCSCLFLILIAVGVYFLFFKKESMPDWDDLGVAEKEIINKIVNNMVFVDGGTFIMGNTPGQDGYCHHSEEYTHKVTLTQNYLIGKYEITRMEWLAVMGEYPEIPEVCSDHYRNTNPHDPITGITWEECQKFIRRLNHLFPEHLFRLPTEAEWEFAARGGRNSHNYRYAGSNDKEEVAWDGYDYPNKMGVHPVGQKVPNELGLYDMSGNAQEWCQDSYYQYDTQAQINPKHESDDEYKVIRGGCYYHGTECVSQRDSESADNSVFCLGFRLAADY